MQTEIDIDESACMRSHSHFWVKTACFPVLRFLRIYTPASQAREFDAIHTSELDRSEIDLSPKRSECERSNANWDWSKDRSKRAWTLSQSERRSIWDRPQFALRKCSHSFRSILDRTQFAFERSHSDRFGLRSISDRSNSLVWTAPKEPTRIDLRGCLHGHGWKLSLVEGLPYPGSRCEPTLHSFYFTLTASVYIWHISHLSRVVGSSRGWDNFFSCKYFWLDCPRQLRENALTWLNRSYNSMNGFLDLEDKTFIHSSSLCIYSSVFQVDTAF